MLQTIINPVIESLVDISQNPISLTILCILSVLIVLLFLAIFISPLKILLIDIKVLEKGETPASLLKWIIGIIIIVKLIQIFIIQPFIVDGLSMSPTFADRDFLLVDKLSYRFGYINRGDVAIFKFYEGGKSNPYTGKYLIKRIMGLPGERIVINNGTTTIYNKENPNGLVLDQSFVAYADPNKNRDITLDDHHYFVMGDNRSGSYDSRDWGPLDAKYLKGQVLLRILPIQSFTLFAGRHSYNKDVK